MYFLLKLVFFLPEKPYFMGFFNPITILNRVFMPSREHFVAAFFAFLKENRSNSTMEKHENFFERLARERNISVVEMKEIIPERIEQRLHDPDQEKLKSCEAIPCQDDVPTPEEWLRYAVEKLQAGN